MFGIDVRHDIYSDQHDAGGVTASNAPLLVMRARNHALGMTAAPHQPHRGS
jgi:hypothetical protein